jgi:hypothetical protein
MLTLVPLSAGLTVMAAFKQMLAAGTAVLLSPTATEYEPVDVRAPVENEDLFCPAIGWAHAASLFHWYVYGGVPCEAVAERETDCPLSIF